MSKPEPSVTVVGSVRKADTQALVTNGVDSFPEDAFIGSYYTGGAVTGVSILEPQYKPGVLFALTTQNNTLLQCVSAMEVNIDGTGHSVELIPGATENEAEKEAVEEFFKEPYYGKSMLAIRRAIRRDIESTGNGYMEVIRNAGDEIIMLNHIEPYDMRLVMLDDPVLASKPLIRGGVEVQVSMRVRERRYVQIVNGKKVFFREFGASRDVNRDTGMWSDDRLPVDQRGSEIIHFTAVKEPKTPYGTPRWINQTPSVLGSRKGEEHNLDFFDSGGLPPLAVVVQGGTLGETVREDLVRHLSGKGPKHRAVVIEAISTSGSLDSSGTVNVKFERFGSERQQDAMFQNYDKNCEEHVRCSFRLPPMFIGKAQDYNFATAYTAYMVAEAQVFFPERDDFDAVINNKILRAMGVKSYRFRSLPMTLVDVDKQLKALELVSKYENAKGEGVIQSLNEITGLSLEYEKPPAKMPPTSGTELPITGSLKEELVQLTANWASALGLVGGDMGEAEKVAVRKQVAALEPEDLEQVNKMLLTMAVMGPGTLTQSCGCAH